MCLSAVFFPLSVNAAKVESPFFILNAHLVCVKAGEGGGGDVVDRRGNGRDLSTAAVRSNFWGEEEEEEVAVRIFGGRKGREASFLLFQKAAISFPGKSGKGAEEEKISLFSPPGNGLREKNLLKSAAEEKGPFFLGNRERGQNQTD